MADNWKTIRVFISSTFRDMHAERDVLVRTVFPELRRRLEPHRFRLIDIDLRWGVTESQVEDNRVLEFCLEQIDLCRPEKEEGRPFFLGMLGQRYGWVPSEVPNSLVKDPKFAWIDDHEEFGSRRASSHSITALEIIYGVLLNPPMHGQSFFFFRKDGFLPAARDLIAARCPRDEIRLQKELNTLDERYLGDEAERVFAPRLAALKSRIRATRQHGPAGPLESTLSCFHACQRFSDEPPAPAGPLESTLSCFEYDARWDPDLPNPEELGRPSGRIDRRSLQQFGERVLNDLWSALSTRYPGLVVDLGDGAERRDAPSRPSDDDHHERFLESRLQVFEGRRKAIENLLEFVAGDDDCACLVTGPSGSGKSAFLAKLIQSVRQRMPETVTVAHFIGTAPRSTNPRDLLERLCRRVQREFGLKEGVPDTAPELAAVLRRDLALIPADRRLVIVIDGLNQLDDVDRAQDLEWLPAASPPQVKFVVSCVQSPDREERVLQAFDRRLHFPFDLTSPANQLAKEDRYRIIAAVPKLSAKTLEAHQIELLLANPATRNPLFLLVAMEELRGFGGYETLEKKIESFPRPVGDQDDVAAAIFRQVIDRLESEFNPAVVRLVFGRLAGARRGLTEDELRDMLAETPDGEDLFPILLQMRSYLMNRAAVIDFYHRSLFRAISEKYLPSDEDHRRNREALAEYFAGRPTWLPTGSPGGREATPNVRKVDELPYLLARIGGTLAWNRLAELLCDFSFVDSKCRADMVYDLVADFETADSAAPAGTEIGSRRWRQWRQFALLEAQHLDRYGEQSPQIVFQQAFNQPRNSDVARQAGKASELPRYRDAYWIEHVNRAEHFAPSPCRRVFQRASEEILWPPGDLVITTSGRNIDVWHVHDGRTSRTFSADADIKCAILLDGDRRLATVDDKGTIEIWDWQNGNRLCRIENHRRVANTLLIAATSKFVVSGIDGDLLSDDYSLSVHSIENGSRDSVLEGHRSGLAKLVSLDDDHVLSIAHDGTARVWDLVRRTSDVIELRSGQAVGFELLPGRALAGFVAGAASRDEGTELEVWSLDPVAKKCQATVLPLLRGIRELGVEKGLIGYGHEWTVRWSIDDTASPLVVRQSFRVAGVAAIFDRGKQVLLRCDDGNLRSVEADTLRVRREFRGAKKDGPVQIVQDRYVVSADEQHRVMVWDASGGHQLAAMQGHAASVTKLIPLGEDRLLSKSSDHTLRIWEIEPQHLRAHQTQLPTGVEPVVLPDGRVVTRSGRRLDVWDLQAGRTTHSFEQHRRDVRGVISVGDKIASYAEDLTVRVFDPSGGALLHEFEHPQAILSLDHFGDSAIWTTCEDGRLRVFQIDTGKMLDSPEVTTTPIKCHRRLDEHRVATGHEDGTIRVWRLDDAQCIARMRRGEQSIDLVESWSDKQITVVQTQGIFAAEVQVWNLESQHCEAAWTVPGAVSHLLTFGERGYVAWGGINAPVCYLEPGASEPRFAWNAGAMVTRVWQTGPDCLAIKFFPRIAGDSRIQEVSLATGTVVAEHSGDELIEPQDEDSPVANSNWQADNSGLRFEEEGGTAIYPLVGKPTFITDGAERLISTDYHTHQVRILRIHRPGVPSVPATPAPTSADPAPAASPGGAPPEASGAFDLGTLFNDESLAVMSREVPARKALPVVVATCAAAVMLIPAALAVWLTTWSGWWWVLAAPLVLFSVVFIGFFLQGWRQLAAQAKQRYVDWPRLKTATDSARVGKLVEAVAEFTVLENQLRAAGNPAGLSLILHEHAAVLVRSGAVREAVEILEEIETLLASRPDLAPSTEVIRQRSLAGRCQLLREHKLDEDKLLTALRQLFDVLSAAENPDPAILKGLAIQVSTICSRRGDYRGMFAIRQQFPGLDEAIESLVPDEVERQELLDEGLYNETMMRKVMDAYEPHHRAQAFYQLALEFSKRGDGAKAIDTFRQCRDAARECAQDEWVLASLVDEAFQHSELGDFGEKTRCLSEAVEVADRLGKAEKREYMRRLLAEAVASRPENVEEALGLLDAARKISAAAGLTDAESLALEQRTALLTDHDRSAEALETGAQWERLLRGPNGSKIKLIRCLTLKAASMQRLLRTADEIIPLFKETEAIARTENNLERLAGSLLNQAIILSEVHAEREQARKLAEEAEHFGIQAGAEDIVRQARSIKSTLDRKSSSRRKDADDTSKDRITEARESIQSSFAARLNNMPRDDERLDRQAVRRAALFAMQTTKAEAEDGLRSLTISMGLALSLPGTEVFGVSYCFRCQQMTHLPTTRREMNRTRSCGCGREVKVEYIALDPDPREYLQQVEKEHARSAEALERAESLKGEDPTAALKEAEQAEALIRDLGSPALLGAVLRLKVFLLEHFQHWDHARSVRTELENLGKEMDDPLLIAAVAMGRAGEAFAAGKPDAALALYESVEQTMFRHFADLNQSRCAEEWLLASLGKLRMLTVIPARRADAERAAAECIDKTNLIAAKTGFTNLSDLIRRQVEALLRSGKQSESASLSGNGDARREPEAGLQIVLQSETEGRAVELITSGQVNEAEKVLSGERQRLRRTDFEQYEAAAQRHGELFALTACHEQSLAVFRELEAAAGGTRPRVRAVALLNQSKLLGPLGKLEEFAALTPRVVDAARAANDPVLLAQALQDRAVNLMNLGDTVAALVAVDEAVLLVRDKPPAELGLMLIVRGEILIQAERWPELAQVAAELASLKSVDPESVQNRSAAIRFQALAAACQGDFDTAAGLRPEIDALRRAWPSFTSAVAADFQRRATLYEQDGKWAASRGMHDLALAFAPQNPETLNQAAWFLVICPEDKIRDGAAALQLSQRACETSEWKQWAYIDTYAAALAETGDFASAVKYAQRALAVAVDPGEKAQVAQSLSLFQAGRTIRD